MKSLGLAAVLLFGSASCVVVSVASADTHSTSPSPSVTPSAAEFQLPATATVALLPSAPPGLNYGPLQTRTETATAAAPDTNVEACELSAGVGRVPSIDVISWAYETCAGDLATGPIEVEVCPQAQVPGNRWVNVTCYTTQTQGGAGNFQLKFGKYYNQCNPGSEYRTWAWDYIPELNPTTAVAISGYIFC
jgi:hypothetical protein